MKTHACTLQEGQALALAELSATLFPRIEENVIYQGNNSLSLSKSSKRKKKEIDTKSEFM
jgi:hypothetical protein